MKHAIPVSIFFMALSAADFIIKQSTGAVLLFTVSALVFAFLAFLERGRDDRLDAIQKEIAQIRNEISSVAMRLGWGG